MYTDESKSKAVFMDITRGNALPKDEITIIKIERNLKEPIIFNILCNIIKFYRKTIWY